MEPSVFERLRDCNTLVGTETSVGVRSSVANSRSRSLLLPLLLAAAAGAVFGEGSVLFFCRACNSAFFFKRKSLLTACNCLCFSSNSAACTKVLQHQPQHLFAPSLSLDVTARLRIRFGLFSHGAAVNDVLMYSGRVRSSLSQGKLVVACSESFTIRSMLFKLNSNDVGN
jgi:hypothetical protein